MDKVKISLQKRYTIFWRGKCLYALIPKIDLNYYGDVPEGIHIPKNKIFYKHSEIVEVEKLSDLQGFFSDVDRFAFVSKNIESFSKLCCILLLDQGRLVDCLEFYSFLEQRFPVILEKEDIRIESDTLKFLVHSLNLSGVEHLWRYRVNLSTFEAKIEEVFPCKKS